MIEWVGAAAGVCTTIAFLPQALASWRDPAAPGLSKTMLAIFTTGVTLWLTYGLLLRKPALIAANAVTLALALVIAWSVLVRARRIKARRHGEGDH